MVEKIAFHAQSTDSSEFCFFCFLPSRFIRLHLIPKVGYRGRRAQQNHFQAWRMSVVEKIAFHAQFTDSSEFCIFAFCRLGSFDFI